MGRINLRKACRKKEKIYLCSSGRLFKFPGSVRVRRIFTVRIAARHNRTAAGAIKIPPVHSVCGIPGPLPQPGIFLPICGIVLLFLPEKGPQILPEKAPSQNFLSRSPQTARLHFPLSDIRNGISHLNYTAHIHKTKRFHIAENHIRIRPAFLSGGVRAEPYVRRIPF